MQTINENAPTAPEPDPADLLDDYDDGRYLASCEHGCYLDDVGGICRHGQPTWMVRMYPEYAKEIQAGTAE